MEFSFEKTQKKKKNFETNETSSINYMIPVSRKRGMKKQGSLKMYHQLGVNLKISYLSGSVSIRLNVSHTTILNFRK